MSSPKFLSTGGLLRVAALLLLPSVATVQGAIDFSDLSLAPNSYDNGADGAGGFSSGGAFFNNAYDSEWESWGGWSYSNVTDNEASGLDNQYAAMPGGGFGESDIYGVAYVDTFTPTIPRITLPEPGAPLGVHVTNGAYPYYSMLEGDGFSKKFGGESGDDPDFLKLTVTGLTAAETSTGSTEFYLADFRFADNSLDYIVDAWTWMDLGGLGEKTEMLEFTLDSSDMGSFGMNTPAYFALGEVALIPEPGTYALWTGFLLGGIGITRRFLTNRRR